MALDVGRRMASLPPSTWPVFGALIAWCLTWALSCYVCLSLDADALSALFWERVTDGEALEVALAGDGARAGTGRQVASDLGAPWVFECLRLHCPSELLECVRSTTCRGLVREMRRPTHGAPEACLREPADWCGVKCGPASLAYDRCRRASPCDEPSHETRELVMAQEPQPQNKQTHKNPTPNPSPSPSPGPSPNLNPSSRRGAGAD